MVAIESIGTPSQGHAVAISANGSTLAIGGPSDNKSPVLLGSVHLILRMIQTFLALPMRTAPPPMEMCSLAHWDHFAPRVQPPVYFALLDTTAPLHSSRSPARLALTANPVQHR